MKCSYCQTEQEQKKICSFCQANLDQKRPKIKQIVSQEEAYQSQPALALYHTYDLLIMLQFLRKQRTDNYKLMQGVRKAPKEANIREDTISFAQEQYRDDTAYMRVIEGILIDRLGYKPKRIDNKLLQALESKINREEKSWKN